MVATYRLSRVDLDAATETAIAIAREQTLEVPPGVAEPDMEAALLGRVEEVVRAHEDAFDATISYTLAVTGTDLLQLINVAYGNVSLMNGVRLVDLVLPAPALDALPGPKFGIDGLREMTGVAPGRPLLSVAIKPVGRSATELAALAATFARGGAHVVKDDHGLVDQPSAPFRERVRAVAQAVAESNAATGGRCAYFPNVTGPVDTLDERLDYSIAAGSTGVTVCPSLMGLDVMRAIAGGPHRLAILAHPTHGQAAPDRHEGIAPEVLYGTLYRVAGADAVVYVNAGGRFSWPVETCEAISHRLRTPLGRHRAAMPVPAGGVEAAEGARWLARYGPDTMLLIGGSLLRQPDLLGATRRLAEAVGEACASGARA